jgi:hypothetical protein
MRTRREFLASATVTLLLIPLAACASNSPAAGAGADAGGAPDAGGCDGILTTSTNVSEHTHTLCVPQADLDDPPSGGATYTSSDNLDPLNNELHTHTAMLTAAQLSTLGSGGQVVVTSSVNDEHDHQFMIVHPPT